MKRRFLTGISCVTLISGMLWYAYLNEWVIVRNPWESPQSMHTQNFHPRKKAVSLFFWRHDRWHTETVTLSLTDDVQEQIMALVQAWLHEAIQLNLIKTPCTLEAALFDARTQCIYLSFSASPFDPQKSTYTTVTVIESLMKTIEDNIPNIVKSVQFLVHHVPLEHPHLACTRPLSISGFGVTHS